MAYIIPTNSLKHVAGEGSGRLPPLLVVSRSGRAAYRLESLEEWLARHKEERSNPVLHSFSTCSPAPPRPARDIGVREDGISVESPRDSDEGSAAGSEV